MARKTPRRKRLTMSDAAIASFTLAAELRSQRLTADADRDCYLSILAQGLDRLGVAKALGAAGIEEVLGTIRAAYQLGLVDGSRPWPTKAE